MEVFSKISTLQQQQFVYMIDCVWSFLIACVFNLQIRQGRRLQFTSVRGQSDRVCTSANELLKKGGGQQGRKELQNTRPTLQKRTQRDIVSLWLLISVMDLEKIWVLM